MRMLRNEELAAVVGGDLYNWLTPEYQEYYSDFFGGFGMEMEFATKTKAQGSTTVGSAQEAAELIRTISDSMPKGTLKCSATLKGNENGVESWEVTCSVEITRM